jgi:glutathione peroxidase
MKKLFVLLLFILAYGEAKEMQSIYDIEVETIQGETTTLKKYKGDVMLIVNVASKCGYTKQYEGLQYLHETYAKDGLRVLGFPCNQFLGQEPGTEEEILNFCTTNFDVSFDMYSKIDVNGDKTHPLYQHLKSQAGGVLGDAIKWNFTKFLVSREGKVYKRYAPSTKPREIQEDIKKLLAE